MGVRDQGTPVLNENEVVDAVVVRLERDGWTVLAARHGHEQGVDIEARRGEDVLHVEAKGATSSRASSQNFGRPFGPGEVRINVAEAFYTAAVAAQSTFPTYSAIAVPHDPAHERYVEPLRSALEALGIWLFSVDGEGEVTAEPLGSPGPLSGPLWRAMSNRPRIALVELLKTDLPHPNPGVYAIYRDDEPVYVGLAERQSLQERFWGNHRGRGSSMRSSAFRRNVACHLGIASAADIGAGRYRPTVEETTRVNAWVDGCAVAWIACVTGKEAWVLEDRMKHEHLPFLTQR